MCRSVRDCHDTAVKGCNTSGKTFQAAAIGHWWLCTVRDSVLVTTAPSEDLVENLFWRDFRSIHDACVSRGSPLYEKEILKTRVDIDSKWYGVGLTARSGNEGQFQGFHSRRVLFVIDEGSAVDRIFFDARHRIAHNSEDRFLVMGNPFSLAEFYRCFTQGEFSRISISAWDIPNVTGIGKPIPGLLEKATVDRWRAAFGEDSMFWKTRVLAEFWDEGSDGLIPLSWYEAAVARGAEMKRAGHTGKKSIAADVADGGDSETIIGRKIGRLILPFESFGVPDTTRIAHHIEKDMNAGYEIAIVDANGVGSGTASTLRNDRYSVISYKGSNGTAETDSTGELKFVNARSAAYWATREAFNPNNPDAIGLSEDDPRLREDVVGLRYHAAAGGKIAIEEKDKVVKRLGRSPDRGDCLAMLLYGGNQKGAAVRMSKVEYHQRGDSIKAAPSRRKGASLDSIY